MHSQTLQGEKKRALPLLCKAAGVQWLVSEVPEVTCATVRAEQPSTWQYRAGGEGGRGFGQLSRTVGADWQSPDSRSGA